MKISRSIRVKPLCVFRWRDFGNFYCSLQCINCFICRSISIRGQSIYCCFHLKTRRLKSSGKIFNAAWFLFFNFHAFYFYCNNYQSYLEVSSVTFQVSIKRKPHEVMNLYDKFFWIVTLKEDTHKLFCYNTILCLKITSYCIFGCTYGFSKIFFVPFVMRGGFQNCFSCLFFGETFWWRLINLKNA